MIINYIIFWLNYASCLAVEAARSTYINVKLLKILSLFSRTLERARRTHTLVISYFYILCQKLGAHVPHEN